MTRVRREHSDVTPHRGRGGAVRRRVRHAGGDVGLQLADDDAEQVAGVGDAEEGEVRPGEQEVAVDVDAVGFAEVVRDEVAHGG